MFFLEWCSYILHPILKVAKATVMNLICVSLGLMELQYRTSVFQNCFFFFYVIIMTNT